MTLPGHRAVVQHWLDLYEAGGRRVPRLRDIDPAGFPRALSDIWIVDAEPGDVFRFHLAGQTMVDWLGRSPKGLAFHDIYPPDRLREETYAYARDLADFVSPSAIAVIKRQLYDVPFQTLAEATIDANREMQIALKGSDFREGVASFVEKRPPRFTGK